MVALTGSATRPAGSDSHWPQPGTVVPYRLAQPVADIALRAEVLDVPILGIKGNTPHLQKHGDHTPWSEGKKRGVIYAIDLDDEALPGFEQWLVAMCKSTYETRWIDFWNINGSQYDAAGTRLTSSGDQHLHISVAAGYEDTHTTLLTDYMNRHATAKAKGDGMGTRGDDIFGLLHDGKRPGPNQTAGGGVPIAWIVREMQELGDAIAKLTDAVGKVSRDLDQVKADLAGR